MNLLTNKIILKLSFLEIFHFFKISSKSNYFIRKKNIKSTKTLNIFLNYGGQEEIIEIINYFKGSKKTITKFQLNNYFKNKYSQPDLLIRTGGFQRISNFILFQIPFTELFFVKKLWPDLNINDLVKIIKKFQTINRKFGG